MINNPKSQNSLAAFTDQLGMNLNIIQLIFIIRKKMEKHFPGFRQLYRLICSFKQRVSQLLLHSRNLTADRRLGHKQLSGGFCKA